MFRKKYKIKYQFLRQNASVYDEFTRRDSRVPQKGEHVHFLCRGGRYGLVSNVTTHLTHDTNDVLYTVEISYTFKH